MLPSTIGWSPAIGILVGLFSGAIAGSFLSTLVIRWPAGRSIVVGRSACDGCHRRLSALELVPLVSFAIARGRCGACTATIDRRHAILEVLACTIGAVSFALYPGWSGCAGALFGWWLLTLAALDVDHLWLPDRLTLPLLVVGLAVGVAGIPPAPPDRLIGATAGFLSLAAIAAGYKRFRGRTGIGGGDPKLFAAIGAWVGWHALPATLLVASISGLLVAGGLYLAGKPVSATSAMPFGAFLAFAGWIVWVIGLNA